MRIQADNQNFRANPGPRLLRYIERNEFAGNNDKTQKFAALFRKTFDNITDLNTTVDVDKHLNFVYSHKLSPHVKYCQKTFLKDIHSVAKFLLNACTKEIMRGEYLMFRNLMTQKAKAGTDLSLLREGSKVITNPRVKEEYLETVEILERLKTRNPETLFTKDEFDEKVIKKMEEDAKKPGTGIYEAINNLDKLTYQ